MTEESINDMVYDASLSPVWCGTPKSCKDWLLYQLKTRPIVKQYSVRVWQHGKYTMITVQAYLNGGK